MDEMRKPPDEPLDDPVAGSANVTRRALGAAAAPLRLPQHHGDKGSAAIPIATPDQLRTIRTSLDRLPIAGFASNSPLVEARSRLAVALAALPSGERRAFARWPFVQRCEITLDGVRLPALTLDIGRGGLMLAPVPGLEPGDAKAIELELLPEGPIAATISVDQEGIGHVAFQEGAEKSAGLADLVRACAASFDGAFRQAMNLATDVKALFETALGNDVMPRHALFAPMGYDPHVLEWFSSELSPLLARSASSDADFAYAAGTDIHGYVVAEHAGPGQILPRQGRQFSDAVTWRAARFSAGPIAQVYRQPSDCEPACVQIDVSAPVIVRGRRWGCVQIGRNPVLSKPH